MRSTFTVLATAVLSVSFSATVASADEYCENQIGLKEYTLEADDGALAAANSSRFRLVYWENNELKTVADAKISISKMNRFDQRVKTTDGPDAVKTTITDYAARIRIRTTSTEIYPAMMGNPAMKDITVSTMCTSLISAPRK